MSASPIDDHKRKHSETEVLWNNDSDVTSKRFRSSSPLNYLFNALNDIVQYHRDKVHEIVDFQREYDASIELTKDEQHFFQTEEDYIKDVQFKIEATRNKVTNEIDKVPVRTIVPSSHGKRQRGQLSTRLTLNRTHPSSNDQHPTSTRVAYETDILKRVEKLKSEGKWLSEKRLTKSIEYQKRKTHWDYLLDEMQWLSEDFQREKKWKQLMAKKLSQGVLKYFKEKSQHQDQKSKEEEKRKRKTHQFICKEVMNFWKNIQKIAEYKESTRSKEIRRHALDLHLNFIVDQTEKYSNWLVESLKPEPVDEESRATSESPSSEKISTAYPLTNGIDNKTSIERSSYPTRLRSTRQINDNNGSSSSQELAGEIKLASIDDENDKEFQCDEEEIDDNEQTIEEEEQMETPETATNELDLLEKDQEESIESLLKKYYGIDVNAEQSNSSSEKENIDTTISPSSQNYFESIKHEEDDDESDEDDQSTRTPNVDDVKIEKTSVKEEKTNKELDDMALTAQGLQPTGFTLTTTNVKTPIPFLIKHSLREYQHVGLDWLVTLYENKLNGILADEMGLGKTIQTIALLAHLACEKSVWGPHLIVVPTSVMLNWELEFKKWCPSFKILTYYGSVKERKEKRKGWTRVNAFHICITSYKLVLQDSIAFRRKKWKYLILDEAHNIKNFKSQRWQILLNFHSQRRLLLTGTPLQNSLMELWSLMHFLMPNLFASHHEFREWFSNPLTEMIEHGQEQNDALIKRLHKVLRPFLLRRLKIDVEKQMPKKYEHLILCKLSKRQRFLYDDFIECRSTKDILSQGHYMSVINILMQLRKVCNHPDLFEQRQVHSPYSLNLNTLQINMPKLVIDDIKLKNPLLMLNNNLLNNVFLCCRVKYTLQATKQAIQSTIDHSPLMNTNDLTMMKTTITNKKLNLDDYINEEYKPEKIYFNIVKQRKQSRLERLHLMGHLNVDRCSFMPVYGEDMIDQVQLVMKQCRFKHSYNSWLHDGYSFCHNIQRSLSKKDFFLHTNCLKNLLKLNEQLLDDCYSVLNRFVLCTIRVLSQPIELYSSGYPLYRYDELNRPLIEVISSTNFDVLSSLSQIKQNMLLQFPERRLIQYDCGKLQALDKLLSTLKHEKHRCLIFTQMTKMLDILELFLNHHGYTYLRLDGTTQIVQRQQLMERFNSDEKVFCFILSTRSGGIGVNLTGADTVIFYDSDWNPTMDAQAQDRCHRIGQTKDVHIYRLISENTVEQNILKKAQQKRLLGDLAIEGGCFDVHYFRKNNIQDLFDQSTSLDDIVRERNEYQQQMETNRTTTPESSLSLTQFEEALASAEDETDRNATEQLNNEVNDDTNEFDNEDNVGASKEDQLIEKQKQQMDKVEQDLKIIDEQLKPIERYALKFVELHRGNESSLDQSATGSQLNYFDSEQIRKDWHLSRLKALKEEEEKFREMEEDEIMFVDVHDNERKMKYAYTYLSAQNSLVASELAKHEKTNPNQDANSNLPSLSLPIKVKQKRSKQQSIHNDIIRDKNKRRGRPPKLITVNPIEPLPTPPVNRIQSPLHPSVIRRPPVNQQQARVPQIIMPKRNQFNHSYDECTETLAVNDEDHDSNDLSDIFYSKSKTTSAINRRPIPPNMTIIPQQQTSLPLTVTNSAPQLNNNSNTIWIVNTAPTLNQQTVVSLLNNFYQQSPTVSQSVVINTQHQQQPTITNLITEQPSAHSPRPIQISTASVYRQSPIVKTVQSRIFDYPSQSPSTSRVLSAGTVYRASSSSTSTMRNLSTSLLHQTQSVSSSSCSTPSNKLIYQISHGCVIQKK